MPADAGDGVRLLALMRPLPGMSELGRLLGGMCCKSRFAQVAKNSAAGRRRDFRVKT
jgi:hypothetical protein